jgi:Transposase DDE domain
MLLGPIFERFVAGSPLSVMARATLEHALAPRALDDLFERTRDKQYTRELLFSSVVDLMSLVVCGIRPHIKAAFQAQKERIPVTLKCVYEKLQHLETHTSAELVRFAARRCEPLIRALQGARHEWLPGYRVKVVDGNHLSGTEHRLRETRDSTAAPLPGLSLVVLDPALMMAIDVLPCEDGHAQERSLLGDLLGHFEAGDVCIADRNFCTADFLSGLVGRGAFPVIRRHANLTLVPKGAWGKEVGTATGWVSERPVGVMQEGVEVLQLRCIRVRLKKPTREGETEIEILTNLPAADADATKVAELYLGRWTVEGMFQDLTENLGCEVNTLCYPKAALFGFCVALVAYNVLAVTKAALRSVHGEKKIEEEVSGYYVALEWGVVYAGMMIAIPAEEWVCFRKMGVGELATILRELASRVNLEQFKKSPRRPKGTPRKRRNNRKQPHVSTARILEARKKAKLAKR